MDKKIVFIAGNSRSGTTMMARILNNSNLIHSFNELHYFEGQIDIDDITRTVDPDKVYFVVTNLMKNILDGFFCKRPTESTKKMAVDLIEFLKLKKQNITYAELFIKVLSHLSPTESRLLVDQTPRNVLLYNELNKAYPEAKFIFLVRDPRDILLSQKNKWKRRFLGAKNIPLREAFRAWSNYHPIVISKIWNANSRSVISAEDKPNVKVIQYEQLVRNSESTVKEIFDFIDVQYYPDFLKVPHVGSSDNNDKSYEMGISVNSIELWKKKLNHSDIEICEKICSENMTHFKYECSGITSTFTFIKVLSLPFKLGFSLIMNLGKARNILKVIKKRL